MGGLIGIIVGLACAVAAAAWTVRQNMRAGSSKPLAEALGFGVKRSRAGIERAVTRDAGRYAFPLFAVFAVTYVLVNTGSTEAGVIAGTAGAIYGSCAAFAGHRLRR